MPSAAGSAGSPASAQSSQDLLLRGPGRLSRAGDGALQPGVPPPPALPVSWGFTRSPPGCGSCGPSGSELKTGHLLAPRWWLLAPWHPRDLRGPPRRVLEVAVTLAPPGLRLSPAAHIPAQPQGKVPSGRKRGGLPAPASSEVPTTLTGCPTVRAHTRSLLPSFEGSQKVAARFCHEPPAFTGRVTGSLVAPRQVSERCSVSYSSVK